jgi:hypothetical protein
MLKVAILKNFFSRRRIQRQLLDVLERSPSA